MYPISKKAKNAFFLLIILVIALVFQEAFRETAIFFSRINLQFAKTDIKKQADLLNQQKIEFQLKTKQLKNLTKENQVLREALNFKESNKVTLIGAEIAAFSPSAWQKHFFINSGKNQGITENLLVIDKNGYLIGKTTLVKEKQAKVILLENAEFKYPVLINQKISGLLQGGVSGLEVLFVEKTQPLNLNDLVYAGILPFESLAKVGKISRIRQTPDSLFSEIKVEPFATGYLPSVVFILK